MPGIDDNRLRGLSYGGQTYRYDFDDAGRLTDLYEDDGTPALLARFTYNARGQVDLRTEGVASSVDPAYDRIGRLTSLGHAFAGGSGNVTLGFTLNPASQIDTRTRNNDSYAWIDDYDADVSRSYAVNGLNQYSAAGGTTFSYDANGNLTSDGSDSYVYDIENRLVSASGGHTATLRYDPLGRLFEVTGTSTPRRFLWDGDALVAEYTSTGSLGARFVHGTAAGVDDPLVWYGGGENRRLHADHQGSIIAITDGTGAIKWINGYDEWGIPNAPNNTGRFQYTGQLWIGELGMYHYKARIYSPTLGRFLQVDPVGYDDQVNLYAYVGNDPINWTDPSGLYSCQGSPADCQKIRSYAAQLRTAARRANETGSRIRSNYQAHLLRVANFIGRPGEDTGVRISNEDLPGRQLGDNGIGADGANEIRLDLSAIERPGSRATGAGVLAHEGTHGLQKRDLGGIGVGSGMLREVYRREIEANGAEQAVNIALGQSTSLWAPGMSRTERMSRVDQGARASCEEFQRVYAHLIGRGTCP